MFPVNISKCTVELERLIFAVTRILPLVCWLGPHGHDMMNCERYSWCLLQRSFSSVSELSCTSVSR